MINSNIPERQLLHVIHLKSYPSAAKCAKVVSYQTQFACKTRHIAHILHTPHINKIPKERIISAAFNEHSYFEFE